MNQTHIYGSRKLEKTSKEIIVKSEAKSNTYLGEWTATLFYVSHKKCWLLINKLSKYIVVIPDIKNADIIYLIKC